MKLGITGKMAEGKSLVGKGEKGMAAKGEGKEGTTKGGALTEDGALLSGLGYNTVDHRSSAKNVSERANLERFLKEMGPETGKEPAAKKGGEEAAAKNSKEAGDTKAEAREAREAAPEQAAAETARDGREDGRIQGQAEAQEAAEARETPETQEAEAEHQGGQGKDEDEEQDKPGAGWLAEELEDDRGDDKVALKTPDALSEGHRCHGTLGDGSRCLRRSVKGARHCREHYVPTDPAPQA